MVYRVKSFDVSNTISGGANITGLAYRYFNAILNYCYMYGQLNLPVHRKTMEVDCLDKL